MKKVIIFILILFSFLQANHLQKSKFHLPYEKTIDPKTVKYYSISSDLVKGIKEFSCGEEPIRYLPLPNLGDINVVLVPQDCGDFDYRYYLLTIKNNTVKGNLYVEGYWYEPDNEGYEETTTFSLDEKYNIVVKTKNSNSSKLEVYNINNNGEIMKK